MRLAVRLALSEGCQLLRSSAQDVDQSACSQAPGDTLKKEAAPRFELGVKDLQSSALPLGHAAVREQTPKDGSYQSRDARPSAGAE